MHCIHPVQTDLPVSPARTAECLYIYGLRRTPDRQALDILRLPRPMHRHLPRPFTTAEPSLSVAHILVLPVYPGRLQLPYAVEGN